MTSARWQLEMVNFFGAQRQEREGEDEVGRREGRCVGEKVKDRTELLFQVRLEAVQRSNLARESETMGQRDWSDVTISVVLSHV